MNRSKRAAALACLLLTLAGCAHDPGSRPAPAAREAPAATPSAPAPAPTPQADAPAWSSAAFRFAALPSGGPDWRLDHVIAGEVVAPLIARHGAYLQHWRVHRRAAPDAAGHQFTLFMYTSPAHALTVFDELGREPVIEALAREGHLRQLVLLEGGPDGRPGVADTSDPNWSPELARSWPRFIQGVSDAWIALVLEHTPPPKVEEALDDTIARYGVAAEAVASVWRDEGTHAYLHHISAVFGYSPLLVRF